ncbi:hypothetical protein [Salmonella enterica]|nr:hypothetical protein [Salmonella enterica]
MAPRHRAVRALFLLRQPDTALYHRPPGVTRRQQLQHHLPGRHPASRLKAAGRGSSSAGG